MTEAYKGLSNICRVGLPARLQLDSQSQIRCQVASFSSDKATEEEAMLRSGIVALMITVMGACAVQADEGAKPGGLLGFLRGTSLNLPANKRPARSSQSPALKSSGVAHAVVADADKQVPEIRQVSNRPEKPLLQPAEQAPQPTPVQYGTPQFTQSQDLTHSAGPTQQYPAVPVGLHSYPSPIFVSGAMPHSGGYVQPPATNAPMQQMAPAFGMPYSGTAGGALYPAPRPGIPGYVGGTSIPNPAFHPHELMYTHRYKALYGPYYHQVKGCWMLTPFGVWSKERWKLRGTQVDVKYKNHISPFALFSPPVIR